MPIPPFDSILNILPPHAGNPAIPGHVSPYLCTAVEVCTRFGTTTERRDILRGFLNLRAELHRYGIRGFQWLAGSFVEDIEAQEGRSPRDVDVVTFVEYPADRAPLMAAIAALPELVDPAQAKVRFMVDHFFIPLSPHTGLTNAAAHSTFLVEYARYWYALFSHRRDQLWKGLLRVELFDKQDDNDAAAVLGGVP